MRKSVLIPLFCLLALIIIASICLFSMNNKDLKHQRSLNEILINNQGLRNLITQQSIYNFSMANGEIILHSYLKREPLGQLSELLQNKSYIFYCVSENACNPCVSDLNERVLLALNEIDKSSFFIVGPKNHIYDQSNEMKYLNIDLKDNLLISFNSFFLNNIEENTSLILFTMDESLKCNNLFIIHDANIHLIDEFLSNACFSLKNLSY
jgi:hypothetical protein